MDRFRWRLGRAGKEAGFKDRLGGKGRVWEVDSGGGLPYLDIIWLVNSELKLGQAVTVI